jgi:hypothetical protein
VVHPYRLLLKMGLKLVTGLPVKDLKRGFKK